MGCFSTLRIGKLDLDISKNHLENFSSLFSSFDYKEVTHYYEGNFSEEHFGYSRKLYNCKQRLELLGYTDEYIKILFNIYQEDEDIAFNIEDLQNIIRFIDINISVYDENDDYYSNTDFSRKITNIINTNDCFKILREIVNEISYFIDSFDAYFILKLFIMNNLFLNEDVVWEYYDLVQGGYVTEEEVSLLLENTSKVLLITEGSSDTLILKSAIEWIYPDIKNFFEFIDMEKNYPFTGAGNIVNFYHGICKIESKKNIVFIFDNDTAGVKALNSCIENNFSNIKKTTLLNLDEFRNFITLGPNGESNEDINERAVSIELFLDLNYMNNQTPMIRWTSYDESTDKYQGVLINKEKYVKKYFDAFNKRSIDYSLNKLKLLLDYIISIVENM